MVLCHASCSLFFFFNDTATTEIYTLSLHDALPILGEYGFVKREAFSFVTKNGTQLDGWMVKPLDFDASKEYPVILHQYSGDRKSTRLNSSHANISYAVFCLKKKN